LPHAAGSAERDLTACHLTDNRVDQRILDRDRRRVGMPLVENIEWLANCRLGVRGGEMLKPKRVAQKIGYLRRLRLFGRRDKLKADRSKEA
jgi:hypothetical protein